MHFSCERERGNININQIIVYILVFFALVAALDCIVGNKLGLGVKFREGIDAMGPLTFSMAGILVLTPVFSDVLKPLVVPVFRFIHADPSMFAGMLLGIDMGAAPLAEELAESQEAAALSGIITGSMLGATIVFTIPVALGIIETGDKKLFAKGILLGAITIPFGVIAGGITAGFELGLVFVNTVPVALLSAIIALGMWKWERIVVNGFMWFGKFIVAVSVFGLAVGIISTLTGVEIFERTMNLKDVFIIVGNIGITLAGAFPFVHFMTKLLKKPLLRAGTRIGINESSTAGFLISLPNSIPMLGMIKDMDPKGKVMNIAFSVSGAYVLGDHLGFTAAYAQDMIVPMIIGKMTAGVSAVILAYLVMKKSI